MTHLFSRWWWVSCPLSSTWSLAAGDLSNKDLLINGLIRFIPRGTSKISFCSHPTIFQKNNRYPWQTKLLHFFSTYAQRPLLFLRNCMPVAQQMGLLPFLPITFCHGVIQTHVSRVVPDLDLWSMLYRQSYSAAANHLIHWKLQSIFFRGLNSAQGRIESE